MKLERVCNFLYWRMFRAQIAVCACAIVWQTRFNSWIFNLKSWEHPSKIQASWNLNGFHNFLYQRLFRARTPVCACAIGWQTRFNSWIFKFESWQTRYNSSGYRTCTNFVNWHSSHRSKHLNFIIRKYIHENLSCALRLTQREQLLQDTWAIKL